MGLVLAILHASFFFSHYYMGFLSLLCWTLKVQYCQHKDAFGFRLEPVNGLIHFSCVTCVHCNKYYLFDIIYLQ
jgi:hypothetical protein